MQRCLSLASNGLGLTRSNPMVGAVLVHQDNIIGEGFTSPFGGNHAEVNCINSVAKHQRPLIQESTLYVSLEPCSHIGKTPACSLFIIQQKIPKVVISTLDPFEKVCGNGLKALKENGINVVVGILEKEAIALNKRFFTYHTKKRPYIILKWAETKNGCIDINRSKPTTENNWITNSASKQLTHKWRTEEQAIVIATNTAQNDNPKLTARMWKGENPLRVILDLNLRLPTTLSVFDKSTPTIIITTKKRENEKNLTYITIPKKGNVANEILKILYNLDINSIIVEGGKRLLQTFIDANLWDEARIFQSDIIFKNGLKAPALGEKIRPQIVQNIGTDKLKIYTK